MPQLLDMSPGRGTLLVPVPDKVDFLAEATRITDALKRSIPVDNSYMRRSHFLVTHSKQLVYGTIRHEVTRAVEAYNRHSGRGEHIPIMNDLYLRRWFDKYGFDREQVLASLGVAGNLNTTFTLGTTPKGGRFLFIINDPDYLRIHFNKYWEQIVKGRPSKSLIFELVVDIAIMTALDHVNRLLLYYQLAQELGWQRVIKPEKQLSTPLCGIAYEHWELFDECIRVSDDSTFAVYSEYPYSVVICHTPRGSRNKPYGEYQPEDLPVRNSIKAQLTAMPHADNVETDGWEIETIDANNERS